MHTGYSWRGHELPCAHPWCHNTLAQGCTTCSRAVRFLSDRQYKSSRARRRQSGQQMQQSKAAQKHSNRRGVVDIQLPARRHRCGRTAAPRRAASMSATHFPRWGTTTSAKRPWRGAACLQLPVATPSIHVRTRRTAVQYSCMFRLSNVHTKDVILFT